MMQEQKPYKPRFFEDKTMQKAMGHVRKQWEIRREITKKMKVHPTVVVLPKHSTRKMEQMLEKIIQIIQQRHPSCYPVRIAPYTEFAPIKEQGK